MVATQTRGEAGKRMQNTLFVLIFLFCQHLLFAPLAFKQLLLFLSLSAGENGKQREEHLEKERGARTEVWQSWSSVLRFLSLFIFLSCRPSPLSLPLVLIKSLLNIHMGSWANL